MAFTGNRPVAAVATATRVLWACGFEDLAEDPGFHGLATEAALQFTDTVLEFPDAADWDDLLVCPDRLVPALGRTSFLTWIR